MILEAFTRTFVDAGALDASVAFYKALLSGDETLRFADPETGLELAAVSSPNLSVLIIAGPPDKRAPFEATRLTIKVDALEPFLAVLKAARAEQLEPIQTIAGRPQDALPPSRRRHRRIRRSRGVRRGATVTLQPSPLMSSGRGIEMML
jgi:hypothetical protein